ncbi:unnamed protein product [Cyprideis torosa]|uniref:Uncharacterized protein n=1 Tax=Cyprideis torosa TaxID=163714 RepID=A0A7R8WE86_9CRUS|nr:unnamed protein product [Cyprideis torosa]CAG0889178.1 unnamed protein product [Cyprideis torosa]
MVSLYVTWATIAFLISLVLFVCLTFFAIFHLICFDELRSDYRNPVDHCKTLNPVSPTSKRDHNLRRRSVQLHAVLSLQLILPEYILHFFIVFMFVLTNCWITVGLNLPLAAFHIWRYWTRPVMSSPGIYDPTAIMDKATITWCLTEGWCKLGFYGFHLFYCVCGAIYTLLMNTTL